MGPRPVPLSRSVTGEPPAPHDPGTITSTKNPRVKAAIALRDRRARDETGLTLVDGVRELARALAGGARAVEVFVVDHSLDEAGAAAVQLASAGGATIVPVTGGVLDRLGYGERSEGVVATVRIPDVSLGRLADLLPADPLVVVLEGVEKPGNLGAVLRSADAAGADAVVVADPRTDLFNPNAIRASLGTVFAVPVAAGASGEVRAWLEAAGIPMFAARVGAAVPYTAADLRGPAALVLGSEAEGLTDAWTGPGVTAVSLPMLGVADSLNVSVTGAVLLYEARRQRGTTPA
jgi:TrmH family RNA methyltransferase